MINWTQKEKTLLKDLQQQEQLCVDKYRQYADRANDPELQQLFTTLMGVEQQHHQMVTGMLNGQLPQQNQQNQPRQQQTGTAAQTFQLPQGMTMQQAMEQDKFLCMDALCTEKEVSGAYNVSIFEFRDPQVRQILNQIQGAEQHHGEMLYQYMARNGMYQAQ